jgi:RHS repeat-associated protein
LKTNYTYWGLDYGTTAHGKLWEIKTQPQSGGTALQDMQYTWDAAGNLTQRQNLVSSETENFTYDSLDRLTAVSGAYTQSYAYNTIGNITSMNGTSYTYGDSSHKHAVTSVGTTNYAYDPNGNMTTRGAQTITWDVENRPVTITGWASFVYDGDGNRVKKTEGGQTILYVNQYYEKNLTTGVVTTYYYLGGQLVAQSTGGTLKYIHQDSLGSTSVMSTSTGTVDSSMTFYPFGATRTGSVNTPKEFTGQRLEGTGLYYYGARYYDATIGRFISPDTVVQDYKNPQNLNRYSYCANNPLNRTDPSGHSFGSFFKNVINKTKAAISTAVNIIKANPIGVLTAVVCIAAVAIVAAPLLIAAAGMISTAVAAGGIGGLATLGAAAVGIGTAAAEEAPEIIADLTNTMNAAETIMEGDAYVNTAGCGLPETMSPNALYHYTPDPDIIMKGGINSPSGINYATDDPWLSPSEAQIGLNLNPNNPLPTNVYRIDIPSLLNSGRNLYGHYTITGSDGLPTGHLEWITDSRIPPWMLDHSYQ